MEKRNATEKAVYDRIAPLLAETPYEIYDVEYSKEGSERFLRIFIDKDGGVDLDDCEAVTDLVNDPLDALDPIGDAYFLEISSPGVERHLRTDTHFKAAVGEKVRLKTYAKVEKKKEWVGKLLRVDENELLLDVDGREMAFPREAIAKANLSVF